MRWLFVFAAVFACAAATVAPAFATNCPSGSFAAARAENAAALDATVTDTGCSKALTADGMEVVTTQKPSPRPSRFLLLYDDANLSVGMKLEQGGIAVT